MAEAWDVTDAALLMIADAARAEFLNLFDTTIHLFQNDYTPVPGMVEGDFVEADFTGYATQVVPDAGWAGGSVTDHVAKVPSLTTLTFTSDPGASSQTIYGYYAMYEGDSTLVWAERFGSPRVMNPGDVMNLTPVMRFQTLPSA